MAHNGWLLGILPVSRSFPKSCWIFTLLEYCSIHFTMLVVITASKIVALVKIICILLHTPSPLNFVNRREYWRVLPRHVGHYSVARSDFTYVKWRKGKVCKFIFIIVLILYVHRRVWVSQKYSQISSMPHTETTLHDSTDNVFTNNIWEQSMTIKIFYELHKIMIDKMKCLYSFNVNLCYTIW